MINTLTVREKQVLELVAEGLSNKLIADRLNISDWTAKFHVENVISKLGAGTRTKAAVMYIAEKAFAEGFAAAARKQQCPKCRSRSRVLAVETAL